MRISSTWLITAERGALRCRHAARCCTGAGPARPHEGAAPRLQALRLVRSWLGLAHPNPNPNPDPNPDPSPNPGTVRIGTIRSLRVTCGSRRGRRRTTSCVSRRDGDSELARYTLPRCIVTHLLAHLVDPLLTAPTALRAAAAGDHLRLATLTILTILTILTLLPVLTIRVAGDGDIAHAAATPHTLEIARVVCRIM